MSTTPAADRRAFLALPGWGLAATLFPGVLWAQIRQPRGQSSRANGDAAAAVSASTSPTSIGRDARRPQRAGRQHRRDSRLEPREHQAPALLFDPCCGGRRRCVKQCSASDAVASVRAPKDIEELAFAPVMHLAVLRSRKIIDGVDGDVSERLTRLDPRSTPSSR
jgi:hypothetical protein